MRSKVRPGFGKTALLRHIGDEVSAHGARLLTARGIETERDLVFGGMNQLLSGLSTAGSKRGVDPDWHVRTVAEELSGMARSRPLAVLVDDAHWLDTASLQVLCYLQPRISSLAFLLVIATRREHDGAEDHLLGRILADPDISVVRPSALSGVAVSRLVEARFGPAPPPFVEACEAATGGNPFFVSALLAQLQEDGVQPSASEVAAVQLAGPRDIVRALRFRGVAHDEGMALARAVSILGDGASIDMAISLAGIDRERASAAADALVRDGYFAPGPRLAFAHPIIGRAVYVDMGSLERSAAHKRAAQLLDVHDEAIDHVAAQLLDAEPSGDGWTVAVLRNAATAASQRAAPDLAARYLRRALAEPPVESERADVLLELGRAEERAGEREAFRRFIHAYGVAQDPETRAEAAIAAAGALTAAGDERRSVEMLAAATAELPRITEQRALEFAPPIGLVAMYEPDAASSELARLDAIDEDELSGDRPVDRRTLCVIASRRMWRSNDARRTVALIERALAGGRFAREAGSESFEINLAVVTLVIADELTLAGQVTDALADDAMDRGTRYGRALSSLLRSEIEARRGALVESEAYARIALALTQASGHAAVASVAAASLCVARFERGAYDSATAALREVDLDDGDVPPDALYTPLLSARGRLWMALGQPKRALVDLYECGARRERLESRNPLFDPWRGPAALAHRALGEGRAARRLAEEDVEAARDWGTPGALGAALRVMALTGDGSASVALLLEAVANLGRSPARLEHAKALVELGAALRRGDQRKDARVALVQGLDLADRCGAALLARDAREELAAIGVRPRRTRLTGAEALTGSELRVARLAADGLTNVEIAGRLFVSRKTVEKHLGNAYEKLGVGSRAGLSTYLPRDDPSRNPDEVASE